MVCGLLLPRAALPTVLEAVSDVLPLSYAVDAMAAVATSPSAAGAGTDLLVVLGFTVGLLLLGALTLRRRTP